MKASDMTMKNKSDPFFEAQRSVFLRRHSEMLSWRSRKFNTLSARFMIHVQYVCINKSPCAEGAKAFFSPHLCVGFLFLILYPAPPPAPPRPPPPPPPCHTQLCHTPLCHTPSFTHNFVTCLNVAGLIGTVVRLSSWLQGLGWKRPDSKRQSLESDAGDNLSPPISNTLRMIP